MTDGLAGRSRNRHHGRDETGAQHGLNAKRFGRVITEKTGIAPGVVNVVTAGRQSCFRTT